MSTAFRGSFTLERRSSHLCCMMYRKTHTVNSHLWLLARGLLHLDSAATRHTRRGVPLWLHRPMHQDPLTKGPSWPSMPSQKRYSTENVLPHRGFSMGTRPFSWKR